MDAGRSHSGRRVLIVDDENIVANTLVAIFKLHGFEARAAYSAEEALGIVNEWRPALALLDVILPRMNGIDLAILLRAESPPCPVILISSQMVTEKLMSKAVEQGHDFPLFPKPSPPQDLVAKAEEMLSGAGPIQGPFFA
jgi:DNA-binding response OmpR family regulator